MSYVDILATAKKYGVIYADPPWAYENRASQGAAHKHYPTMGLGELTSIPIDRIAADDCILFLWVTWPQLPMARHLAPPKFAYKTCGFVWVKTDKAGKPIMGLGNYTRSNTEICLIFAKGRPQILDHGINQLIYAQRRAHSQKPDEVRDLISRLCGDVPKIELFARERVPGWDCWGDDPLL